MIKQKGKLLLLIIILTITFSGCAVSEIENNEQREDKVKKEEINEELKEEVVTQYDINIDFLPEQKMIKGSQTVLYTNNEDEELNNIYFHIYPNAFKKRENLPFLFDDYVRAYPQGFSEGYIDIIEVKVNNEKVGYTIMGESETLLDINLSQRLIPGEEIAIDIKYSIKIPPATERFGYGMNAYNLGNWYPVVAVYDSSGWNIDPYYPIGDPFYTDASNYNVTINAPKDFTLAVTGDILSKNTVDNSIQWNIEANLVRDFAWVASKNFEIVEKNIDGINVKMYYLKNEELSMDIKREAMKYAVDSIKIFNKVIGRYPYKQVSVVQTNFPSGMEYPQIVFVGKEFYNNNYMHLLETIIVHEIAHQWWYGVVGNDQIDESWLDESFASYSEVIYFTENYGEKVGRQYYQFENLDKFDSYEDSLKQSSVLKALNQFEGWEDYSVLVYTKGAIFLNSIKEKYGEDTFYKILNTYYNEYKFKIATTEDFLKVCEYVTGDDLDSYFDEWLSN